MVIMLLCQAVITLRVWYLFSRNACVRTFIVGTLCGSIAASCALLSPLVGDIDKLFTSTTETTLRSPEQIMWLFVPSVTNHSILFVLKVYRFMQSGKSLHMEPPMRRFLKEGMLMYAFAMGSLVSTIPAVVVAVCRAMLSIRSLAATFHVDPEWLLSNAEMSRLPLREGPNKSELCPAFSIFLALGSKISSSRGKETFR
ncbi:hypothetical protein EV401DRAFT_717539 [Pisolithus croceorrhizus]|nr:hypothetical protein EV401DRAFT_717539 [Pisolithus croceorrhizus]